MGKKVKISFKGKNFNGYEELVSYWNKKKPKIIHANPRTVSQKIRKWRVRNIGKKITDNIYEKCLLTRNSTSVILYKKKLFKPRILFRKLKKELNVIIKYSGFHAKLMYWRKQNISKIPSDLQIENFATSNYIKDEKGKYLSPKRNFYNGLPKPKVSWAMLAKKILDYEKRNKQSPNNKEIIKMSKPEIEWMKRETKDLYVDKNKRQITKKEFYDLFDFEKVSFGAWSHRVSRYNVKSKNKITSKKAIELLNPWGVVDKINAIIYKITNQINKKIYIGITTQTIVERFRIHQRTAQNNKLNPMGLHHDIKKFGIKKFKIEKIKSVKNLLELAKIEKEYVKKYNSLAPNGYNLDEGGKGVTLRKLPINFKGKKYNNLNSIALDYNIPVKRLESRLRWGWTLDQATSLQKGILKDSKYTKMTNNESIPILAKKHGIKLSKVYGRLSSGWSLEESLEIKDRQMVSGGAIQYKVDGKLFLSKERLAKFYNITIGALRYRLDNGWTIEEAVGLKKRNYKYSKIRKII